MLVVLRNSIFNIMVKIIIILFIEFLMKHKLLYYLYILLGRCLSKY